MLDLWLQIFSLALQRLYSQAVIEQSDLVFTFSGYREKSFSGLVQSQPGESITKLRSIPPNSEVIVQTNLFHSSYYRDNPKQVLVYVKPITEEDDWQGAIAVPLELLSPTRTKNLPKPRNVRFKS